MFVSPIDQPFGMPDGDLASTRDDPPRRILFVERPQDEAEAAIREADPRSEDGTVRGELDRRMHRAVILVQGDKFFPGGQMP